MSDGFAPWSYGATKALFDYYEQLSEDMGEDIEFDPVAIRCEWSQYPSALEVCAQYDYIPVFQSDEADENAARVWLEERTIVLDVEDVDTSTNEYKVIKSILVMSF
jgi:hypothetical protein